MEIDKILIMPYVTEKTEMLNQNSKKRQVVVFKVHKKATKTMIKQAIYELYKVKAMKVNIINQPYRKTRFRNIVTKKPGFKKAIITLEPGKTIKFE
jgi:large subunit ribosomal protein L23